MVITEVGRLYEIARKYAETKDVTRIRFVYALEEEFELTLETIEQLIRVKFDGEAKYVNFVGKDRKFGIILCKLALVFEHDPSMHQFDRMLIACSEKNGSVIVKQEKD